MCALHICVIYSVIEESKNERWRVIGAKTKKFLLIFDFLFVSFKSTSITFNLESERCVNSLLLQLLYTSVERDNHAPSGNSIRGNAVECDSNRLIVIWCEREIQAYTDFCMIPIRCRTHRTPN